MILTDEERKKIYDFLEKNWALPQNCSVCHKDSWNISPEVFELRSFHGGSMVIGGKSGVVPLILITCANCGNTIFINALVAGLDLKGAQQNE